MKKIFAALRGVYNNIKGFREGYNMVHFGQKDVIYTFYGYGHFRLAKKYADMRKERNGLLHWVVPAGSGAESLVVFNTKERKQLQRIGAISKRIDVNILLHDAYYTTGLATPKTVKK